LIPSKKRAATPAGVAAFFVPYLDDFHPAPQGSDSIVARHLR